MQKKIIIVLIKGSLCLLFTDIFIFTESSNHSRNPPASLCLVSVISSLCFLITTTSMLWTWGLRSPWVAGHCQPTANPNVALVSYRASPPGSTDWTARTIRAWCSPPACPTIAFIWFFGERTARNTEMENTSPVLWNQAKLLWTQQKEEKRVLSIWKKKW